MTDHDDHELICIKALLEKYGKENRCGCVDCRREREEVKTPKRKTGYLGDINGPGCDPDVMP